MTIAKDADAISETLGIRVSEFIAMMGFLLALNAMATDIMLPALEQIGDHFQRKEANDQQLVLFSYLLGFGIPQLVIGPLSDRFGRKGLLRWCLAGFTLTSVTCMFAQNFEALLAFRFAQGAFAAGTQVISTAIIRDLTSGRVMASIMSTVMAVFMIIPIVAPIAGTVIMTTAGWRWTFGALAIAGGVAFWWIEMRLSETLPSDKRKPFQLSQMGQSYLSILKMRVPVGYILASGVAYGALFTFLGASEQIFDEAFAQGHNFWLWFAVIAAGLAAAHMTNARIVKKVGMRRISHAALIAFTLFSAINLMVMIIVGQHFGIFLPIFMITYGCFGLMGANFSSLALNPLGDIAGAASAAYGFAISTISAFIAYLVARQFDDTIIPILTGYVVIGATALVIVIWTEKGRLFHADSQ